MFESISNKISSGSPFVLIGNALHYQKYNKMAVLSKNQAKLFDCLLRGQCEKKQVIDFIWGGGDAIKNDSKYTQLILRTRNKLVSSGFPHDTILTVAKFGVCLNESPSPPADEVERGFIEIDVEFRVINSFHM
ncbi:hypothetical protein [Serratia sp. (in: enterobacteria)]|uniref:hypothetical protein n=1 Tax=Serratia sp. (in: enterobacteria) TaxID=616 RepID=UPI00398911D9